MFYTGFLKRVIPFSLTFTAGLIISSFFVPVMPNFKLSDREGRRGEFYRLKFENEQLRDENFQLKSELESLRGISSRVDETEYPSLPPMPAFDGEIPPPPPAPRAPRHR